MKNIFLCFALIFSESVIAIENSHDYIIVKDAPPTREEIDKSTPSPGPDHAWVRGHWKWTSNKYEWEKGSWQKKPNPAAVWVPGHWKQKPAGWLWIEGHWE